MASEAPRKIPVVFYRTRSGAEVVRDWLRALDLADRHAVARVLFSVHQGRIVALHGFVKKTRKTPNEDLVLARTRKREFEA